MIKQIPALNFEILNKGTQFHGVNRDVCIVSKVSSQALTLSSPRHEKPS